VPTVGAPALPPGPPAQGVEGEHGAGAHDDTHQEQCGNGHPHSVGSGAGEAMGRSGQAAPGVARPALKGIAPSADPPGVDGARCTGCGAALAPDAPWCSLCFTARPQPAPPVTVAAPTSRAQVPAGAAAGAPGGGAAGLYPQITSERLGRHARPVPPDTAGAPDEQQPRQLVQLDADPERAAGAALSPSDEPQPTWPCHTCGAQVPLAADRCPDCGGGFLGGVELPRMSLPLIGDVTKRSKGATYAYAGGAGLLLSLIVVGIVVVLGLL
jgi:hypothetical protein